MNIGVDYYPEHWPEDRWPKDAELMKEAGFNIVRLAEFAWNKLEPSEGKYDFTWLDNAINVLSKKGIKVILGTPTASMPPWVAMNYPEVMAMKIDGTREGYGHRKYNCFSSGAYRLLSERITLAMAKHYKKNPAVVGWQTDNEFDSHPCYCDNCCRAFQDWLRKKHGTIEALTKAWGTIFWAHEYRDWNEIVLPKSMKTVNPGLALDYKRFQSDLNVDFQRHQVHILRKHCKGQFITHNFQESYRDIDYYKLAGDLDFVAWNSYPIWGKPGVPYNTAAFSDVLRGLKGKNFWTMEQVCGNQGWGYMSRSVRPGEIKRLFFQQLSHGADGFLWFRWRTCPFGWEQNAHGMLSYDGVPRRRYNECASVTADCRKIEKEIDGSKPKSDVAMVLDYDSCWATEIQPGFIDTAPGWWLEPGQAVEMNDYRTHFMRYYNALLRAGVNIDIIGPHGEFKDYKALIAPQLVIMPEVLSVRLTGYVNNGGIFLTDIRSGLKDANNNCHQYLLPGPLREALKIRIEEYESLAEPAMIQSKDLGGSYTGYIGCDWIIPEGAKILASYKNPYLKDFAAVTMAAFGKGTGYYVGTMVREEKFYDRLIAHVLKTAGIKPLTELPAGIELRTREKPGSKLYFFINHNEKAVKVKIPSSLKAKILLGNAIKKSELPLPANGVAVLKEE